VNQLSLWWWTTFSASDIKAKVDYLPGLEYLFAHITPDQLDLPDFVVKYDYEVGTAYQHCSIVLECWKNCLNTFSSLFSEPIFYDYHQFKNYF